MSSIVSPPQLATLIPDEPLWIDLRGLLLTARCDVWSEPDPEDGFVAGSWDFPFASVYGNPRPELVLAAVSESRAVLGEERFHSEWQLLAAPESRPLVKSVLPTWKRDGIVLHRWEADLELSEYASGVEIRLLPDGHRQVGLAFDRFPEASLQELSLDWVSTRPIAVAMLDSQPAAYCWAAFITERLWDVAIETLGTYRRQGLAAACFLTLAPFMAEQGKSPAWGAMENNPASLGLAAKLGFIRDSNLDGWSQKV